MNLLGIASVLGLGICVPACSGGSGGPAGAAGGSCPALVPCGGDVVGSWRLVQQCNPPTTGSIACAGEKVYFAPAAGYSATYTFAANGALTIVTSGAMTATLHYPAECLDSDAGIGSACEEIQQSMQSTLQAAADAGTDSSLQSLSISCTTVASAACDCVESITYSPITSTGTYTISGTQITVNVTHPSLKSDGGAPDAGAATAIDYCVSGTTLILGASDGTSNGGTIVLTR